MGAAEVTPSQRLSPFGHESLETTRISTHVARHGVTSVVSPFDGSEELQVRRVIALLERLGTLQARQALDRLAEKAAAPLVAADARAARARLSRQP